MPSKLPGQLSTVHICMHTMSIWNELRYILGSYTRADLHTDVRETSEYLGLSKLIQFTVKWKHYTLCAALAVHDLINKLSDTSSRMLRHSCKVYQGRGPGIDLHGSRSQTVRCLSRSVHLVSFYLISLCQICLPTCWTMYCHAITVISWTKSSFNIELNGSTAVYLFKLSCTCVYT